MNATGATPCNPQLVNEDDLAAISRVQFNAFLPTTPIERLIHPRGMTEIVLETATKAKKRSFHEKQVRYLKVLAQDAQIAAFVRFYVWEHDSVEKQQRAGRPAQRAAESSDFNHVVASNFYGGVNQMKEKHIGGKSVLCKQEY